MTGKTLFTAAAALIEGPTFLRPTNAEMVLTLNNAKSKKTGITSMTLSSEANEVAEAAAAHQTKEEKTSEHTTSKSFDGIFMMPAVAGMDATAMKVQKDSVKKMAAMMMAQQGDSKKMMCDQYQMSYKEKCCGENAMADKEALCKLIMDVWMEEKADEACPVSCSASSEGGGSC